MDNFMAVYAPMLSQNCSPSKSSKGHLVLLQSKKS